MDVSIVSTVQGCCRLWLTPQRCRHSRCPLQLDIDRQTDSKKERTESDWASLTKWCLRASLQWTRPLTQHPYTHAHTRKCQHMKVVSFFCDIPPRFPRSLFLILLRRHSGLRSSSATQILSFDSPLLAQIQYVAQRVSAENSTSVTLTGYNFGAHAPSIQVKVGDTVSPIVVWTSGVLEPPILGAVRRP